MSNNTGDAAGSEPDQPQESHWQRNARTLAAGNLLTNLGWTAGFAFLPLAVQAMGVQNNLELWVGAMLFGYYCTSCAFTPVWGVLADHYGRKSMVLRAAFGMTIGFTLLSMITDPLVFLIVLTITGLANGYIPASQALVATTTPRRHAGGALALTQAGAWAGTMLGPLAGAALLGMLPGIHALYALTAATILAAGLLALLMVREHHVRPDHALRFDFRGDLKRLLAFPELRLLYCLSLLFAFTVIGSTAVVTLFTLQMMETQPGFGGLKVETWVAITLSGFTMASIATLPVWGRVLNRHDTGRVMTVLLAGAVVTSLLLPLARDPLELTVARVLFALFVSGMAPALIRMIRDRAPKGMEARTLSYGTAIQQVGSATAPLIAGVLASYLGLRSYFWLASGLLLLGLVLWVRRERVSAPDGTGAG